MRKLKWLAVVPLLLCCAQVARGQCTGYTITGTSINILSPTNAAKQGAVTASLYGQANGVNGLPLNGSTPSHNITVTPYTYIGFTWTSGNGSSGTMYYTTDNDPTHREPINVGLSGNQVHWWLLGNGDAGHTYHMFYVVTDANGNTSQDRTNITIVSGTYTTLISQDGIKTNAYYQLVSTFGGGSMMNNCGECQGGEIQKCLLATHTPLFDATLTNAASGETQTISNAQAGNVAKAQESVSGTASIMISVLPGDSPTGSTTNKIYCTMFGWVMSQQWNPGFPENEFAITELETIPSTCQLALRFFETGDSWGVQCQVAWKKPPATADRCSVVSQVPDFNPATVWDEQDCKVPGNCNTSDLPPPNGTNANFPKYWYGASWGIRFGGPPAPGQPDPIINGGAHNWVFPIYLVDTYIPGGPDEQWWILDLLNIAVAKGTGLPIDCTHRDKGTSPVGTPW